MATDTPGLKTGYILSIGQDLSIVATDTPGLKTGYILSIGQDLIASNSMVATDTP